MLESDVSLVVNRIRTIGSTVFEGQNSALFDASIPVGGNPEYW